MIGVIGDYNSNLFRGVVGDEILPSYEEVDNMGIFMYYHNEQDTTSRG